MRGSEAGVVELEHETLPRDCPECSGTGEIDVRPHRGAPETARCRPCRGTGKVQCHECESAVATQDDPDYPGALCRPCEAHMELDRDDVRYQQAVARYGSDARL